jgi:hypothetical protein
VALPVLQDADRGDGQDSRSHDAPTKNGPAQPADSGSAARTGDRDGFGGRQSERNSIAAIAAAGKVLDHVVSLAAGQRLLGEGGEQIGIRMRCFAWRLQPLQHDFGNVLHL